MAGSKEATDRPSYHAVGKEDIVAVDRKTFRSDVWEHFGWYRKAPGLYQPGCMQHEVHFPHVAKLARKYLSIPVSTAPAERVFSTAKNILQKKRWRILPERLGKCIFLRHNAKLF